MKVIKPQKLGVVSRCLEHGRRFYLSLGVLALHRLGGAMASEMDMWPFLADELGEDGVPDAGVQKARGEYLVTGYAFTPSDAPQPVCTIRVQVGTLEKALRVCGDRFWTYDDTRSEFATDAEPFIRMPVGWEAAFGGPGFEHNPLGKGFAPIETDAGLVHPLPNVEAPDHPVVARSDRPEPAGLGPIDFTWPQRFAKSGTYDADWTEQLSPGFARDIDWSVFNIAPEDQQQDSPFRGDEAFIVHGMHPERPRIDGRLPGLTVRCFLNSRSPEGGAGANNGAVFGEVAMRLTTVWLFPHAERYLLVFHGMQEVVEEDAADVLHAVVAAERLGEPRAAEHYQRVLEQRLDPDKGALYALREADLLPAMSPDEDEPDQATAEMAALMATEGLRRQHQRRKHAREIEEARAHVASLGLDPDVYAPAPLPPEEPDPSLDELPDLIGELNLEPELAGTEAEEKQRSGRAELRAQLQAAGLDADAILAEAETPPAGPPRFSAQAEMAMLTSRFAERRSMGLPLDALDQMANDPEHQRHLVDAESQLREGYRRMAHHHGLSPRLEGEEADAMRTAVLAGVRAQRSLAGSDLTGCDLSGLDLSGVDLSGAWLENANLAGADLSGATLAEAVLARADLTDTDLSGADLRKANLGLATLRRTRADGADLSEAILNEAKLDGASFRGATLTGADLMEADIEATDMSRATLRETIFLNHDLRGLRLVGADLEKCTFLKADVRGVDFTGASLDGATFLAASGDGATFAGASLAKARFVEASRFPGADFREATLDGANLRGTAVTGSDFSGASLLAADLSECELAGARFIQADARGTLFVKANLTGASLASANLMDALLQRTHLSGADLRCANLFQADLARALMDPATDLEGANLKRARRHPQASPA